MKIRQNFFLFFLLFPVFLHAQSTPWQWAKCGGRGEGYGSCCDPAGNIFIAGGGGVGTSDTFGNLVVQNANPFLAKYDISGNVIWARGADSASTDAVARGVCSDASGNIFITGYFTAAKIKFGNTTLISNGGIDLFLVKYDPNGNVIWARSAGGTAMEMANSICADNAGNVYVTGIFDSPTIFFGTTQLNALGQQNIFIVKYDASGNALWANRTGGNGGDEGWSICSDHAGNIYCTGSFHSDSVVFGTNTLHNSSYISVFIVKFSPSGNAIWAKNSVQQSNGNAIAYGICSDAANNIYIAGYFRYSSVSFNSTSLLLSGNQDAFLISTDSAGNMRWGKSSTGDAGQGYHVNADLLGEIYLTGACGDTIIRFDNTSVPVPTGPDPMFVAKFDTTGTILCLDALSSGGDDIADVCTDTYGNAYIAGDYIGNLFIVGNDTLPPASSPERAFIAQYNCSVNASVHEQKNYSSLLDIFPNPNDGEMQFSYSLDATQPGTIEIFDFTGKLVRTILVVPGTKSVSVNENDLANGIYLCRMMVNGKLCGSEKVVVVK